jgi:hypothetical protein
MLNTPYGLKDVKKRDGRVNYEANGSAAGTASCSALIITIIYSGCTVALNYVRNVVIYTTINYHYTAGRLDGVARIKHGRFLAIATCAA